MSIRRKTTIRRIPPTRCIPCGASLPPAAMTGRPRVYCGPGCRKAAYDDRRARKPEAFQVRVVERTVVETVETIATMDEGHDIIECVRRVCGSPRAVTNVLSARPGRTAYLPGLSSCPERPVSPRSLRCSECQWPDAFAAAVRPSRIRHDDPSSGSCRCVGNACVLASTQAENFSLPRSDGTPAGWFRSSDSCVGRCVVGRLCAERLDVHRTTR